MSAEDLIKPLLGVWKCDNSRTENFEEFLSELGVNFMIRKLAKRSSPTMTISMEGGKFIVKTEAGFTTRLSELPLDGTVIDEEAMGGGKTKAHLSVEDGKLAAIGIPEDPKFNKVVVTREIVNGELIQLINVGDGKVICKRIFKKE